MVLTPGKSLHWYVQVVRPHANLENFDDLLSDPSGTSLKFFAISAIMKGLSPLRRSIFDRLRLTGVCKLG